MCSTVFQLMSWKEVSLQHLSLSADCSELKLFFVFILIGVSFLWSWIVAFGDSTPNTTEKSEWVPHSPFRALFCFDDDITDNSLFSLQSK